jgi:hypothetical protein
VCVLASADPTRQSVRPDSVQAIFPSLRITSVLGKEAIRETTFHAVKRVIAPRNGHKQHAKPYVDYTAMSV